MSANSGDLQSWRDGARLIET